jgi:hypothetical protein
MSLGPCLGPTPELGYKTIIIIIFSLRWPDSTVNLIHDLGLALDQPLNWVLNYDNNHFYSYANLDQLDPLPRPRLVSWVLPSIDP